jgi:hypothetical protein
VLVAIRCSQRFLSFSFHNYQQQPTIKSQEIPIFFIFVILHFHSFYFQGFFLLFLFVRLLFPKKIIKLIKVKRKEKVNKKENENK